MPRSTALRRNKPSTDSASTKFNDKEFRKLLHRDFATYSRNCLKIRPKTGGTAPLVLNRVQLTLNDAAERQRGPDGRGKVRIITLKGRQQGCSTFIEGRFYWRVSHRKGCSVFIIAHEDTATSNLFKIAKRYHQNVPDPMRPSTSHSNAKELIFSGLDSAYKLATAGNSQSGRSDTIQLFHGSEVAFWKDGEQILAGALQTVGDIPNTEVWLESTSNGPQGIFYEMCMSAQRGEGDFELVFIPWWWSPEYCREVGPEFEATLNGEERAYMERYGLTPGQMAWRRAKIVELRGVHNFRREYPATVEEAFLAEAKGALWTRDLIDETRYLKPHPPLARIVVAIDPSGGDGPENDEVGIVVAGIAYDGHCFVLHDASGKYSPAAWGRKAVQLYREFGADRIVAENNYGGAMVESTIRAIDPRVSYKAVRATQGKRQRAEPVAALYEQGQVHHYGKELYSLEDEMVTWEPLESKWSPNRLDALVWAITELALPEPEHKFAFA